MSEGQWNQLSSHPILFKPSYLRLLWPVIHNLILGDVGDMAWGPRIINQLWFSSPFLNLHCWRFMGVMPQGREKWRVAGQNVWVTGRGRIGSKKSHHPLPPTPTTHITCAIFTASFSTPKHNFHMQGRWRQLPPDRVHRPFPWYMFIQRTVALDPSSFSRSAPGTCEAKFLWDPELPLFPLVGRKNRLSPKFRFSYIIAHSRQK